MNVEIDELKTKVEELETRVSKLEKKEKNRKTMAIIKFVIYFVLMGFFLFGAYRLYQYFLDLPNIINNRIKEMNPLAENNLDFNDFFNDIFKRGGENEENNNH